MDHRLVNNPADDNGDEPPMSLAEMEASPNGSWRRGAVAARIASHAA